MTQCDAAVTKKVTDNVQLTTNRMALKHDRCTLPHR